MVYGAGRVAHTDDLPFVPLTASLGLCFVDDNRCEVWEATSPDPLADWRALSRDEALDRLRSLAMTGRAIPRPEAP